MENIDQREFANTGESPDEFVEFVNERFKDFDISKAKKYSSGKELIAELKRRRTLKIRK